MNIEGKRSGSGLVAHKAILVNALSRALAERVVLMDFTIGRKGFLTYLKSLGSSNIVKIVPSTNSSANPSSEERQANGHKRLKVVCGANTSYLEDMAWIGDRTPLSICDVRVSPTNSVKPNLGALELSEALSRVVPFTAKEDNRPVLSCVNFVAKEGKLTLVSADGFRLAVVSLDYDDGEGQVLINRDELRGIASALRRAYRVRVSFEKSGESLDGMSLILDTELIRYRWTGYTGSYPDWEKLIPAKFNTVAHFDTLEAIKAVSSLRVLSESKSYPIDLTIGNGKLVMSSPDDKGLAEIPADTEGEGKIRLDGSYLADALRACGGMVDFKVTNAYSPMLFSVDGYQLVVMPMITAEASEQAKRDSEAKQAETAETVAEEAEKAQAVAEAEAITKTSKPKRKRKSREPVAVA